MARAWTNRQVRQHTLAGKLLIKTKDDAFGYISAHPGASEYEVQQFILQEFKKNKLVRDKDPPIVGFDTNAAIPHYFPKKKSAHLKKNSLVLIDIWARLNEPKAPFSDITWMGHRGTPPKKIKQAFKAVCDARDASLRLVTTQLGRGRIPTGKEIDDAACNVLIKRGYVKNILHRTGHSIGTTSPHGVFRNLNRKGDRPLHPCMGYTIEPGLYFKGKDGFGIRSEIDFLITKNRKLVVTTPIQRKLILIS